MLFLFSQNGCRVIVDIFITKQQPTSAKGSYVLNGRGPNYPLCPTIPGGPTAHGPAPTKPRPSSEKRTKTGFFSIFSESTGQDLAVAMASASATANTWSLLALTMFSAILKNGKIVR